MLEITSLTNKVTTTSVNSQIENITKAFQQGLFKPYEKSLEKWMEFIQQVSKNQHDPKKENRLPTCSMFSILINPNISDENKKDQLISFRSLIPVYEKAMLYFPNCIVIAFLKFGEKNIWEEYIRNILNWRYESNWEKNLYELLNDLSEWPKEDKALIINKLFETLPKEAGDQLIYFILLKEKQIPISTSLNKEIKEESPPKKDIHIFDDCSTELKQRIQSLIDEIEKKGQQLLELKNKDQRLKYKESQRKYFLEWFYANAIDHPNADLVVLTFDEKDWNYLLEKISPGTLGILEGRAKSELYRAHFGKPSSTKLVNYAVQWIVSMTKRLKEKQFETCDEHGEHDPLISLFYHYATNEIEREDGWEIFSTDTIKKLITQFPADFLFLYGYFLKEKCFQKIVSEILISNPKVLLNTLNMFLELKKDNVKKLNDFFKRFDNEQYIKTLEAIYNSSDYMLQISIYCALEEKDRKLILKMVLNDFEKGIATLSNWIFLFFSENQSNLKPLVLSNFSIKFHETLFEIDSSAPKALFDAVKEKATTPPDQSFLNNLLPLGTDLKDSQTLLNNRLDKFKQFCNLKNIPHNVRKVIGSQLIDDFRLSLGKDWLLKLFEEIPEINWPVIFLICFEKMWNLRNVDTKRWTEIVAKTFSVLDNNPFIQCEEDPFDEMTELVHSLIFELTKKTRKLEEILIQLIKIKPTNLIAILNKFVDKYFRFNKDEFAQIFNSALAKAKVPRLEYLADILMNNFSRISFKRGENDIFNQMLWRNPFMTQHEVIDIVQICRNKMGRNFAALFVSNQFPKNFIVEILKKYNSEYGENLFKDCVSVLLYANTDPAFKLAIFHNMCSSYTYAGYDINALLQKVITIYPESEYRIAEWYKAFNSNNFYFDTACMILLNKFMPKHLDALVFEEFKKHLSVVWVNPYDFNLFLMSLNKLGKKDYFIKKLKENSELMILLKKTINENLEDWITSTHAEESIDLIKEIVPNWQKLLAKKVQERMKKDKEDALGYGKKPSYYKVILLYEKLNELKLLNTFRINLTFEDTDCYAQYLEEQKKKANEEGKEDH